VEESEGKGLRQVRSNERQIFSKPKCVPAVVENVQNRRRKEIRELHREGS
jgi:hypothetical protein